jgi:hypothetical protein
MRGPERYVLKFSSCHSLSSIYYKFFLLTTLHQDANQTREIVAKQPEGGRSPTLTNLST